MNIMRAFQAMKTNVLRGSFQTCPLGAVFMLVLIFFFSMRANGAAGKISDEWKDHFKKTPVIENCVFEELQGDRTNLYQVRYQKDAFVMRELGSLGDAALDHITGRSVYAGHIGSNYWAIEGGRVLKLFPDAEKMITEFQNPEVSLIEAPRRKLLGALYYGIHLLDPSSVEWLGESKFTGYSFRGDRLRGEVLEAKAGLPTAFEWRVESDHGLKFITQCKYSRKLDLPYYPVEFSVQAELNGKTIPVVVYRILSLKTSREPLPATYFDSTNYFSRTSDSQILVLSNNDVYGQMKDGSYEKAHAAPTDDTLSGGARRIVIIGFAVLSVIGLSFIWKHAKKHQ